MKRLIFKALALASFILVSLPLTGCKSSLILQTPQNAALAAPGHPLDPLTAGEIDRLRKIIVQDGSFGTNTLFVWTQLREPPKAEVLAFTPGKPFRRAAEVVAISPDQKGSFEIEVDLTADKIESVKPLGNAQPFLANAEFDLATRVVDESAEARAALEKRGYHLTGKISDRFYLDTYAPGEDSLLTRDGKTIRAIRVLFSDRQGGTNSYGVYVEGLMALVDVYEKKIIQVIDNPGAAARGEAPGDIFSRKVLGPKSPDAGWKISPATKKRLALDGSHVRWENWDFRFSFNPREGLVLHQISFHDGDRLRSICYRAAVSEMLVPYSDPSPA